MQYRKDKNGEDISVLGFGCMRFVKNGNKIDMKLAEEQIMHAIEQGINYYDTAYIYSGSEVAIGEIFEKNHVREKIKIATKLPQYLVKSRAALDKYFDEELKRLRTDYIDYYLMHMLGDIDNWNKLKALGIEAWIAEKKASGKIRNIGFSFHGTTAQFTPLIDAYDWDFCQIQYNYLDEHTQAGRAGLQYAARKGIPVIIMEPLRGGRLVNQLPGKAKACIAADEKGRSAATLAFQWLYNQPEVTCVLSGMNSIEMIDENIKTATETTVGSLTKADEALIGEIRDSILSDVKVGCTGCGYCQPCPFGVSIPQAFQCYNMIALEGKGRARREYMQTTVLRANPGSASQCTKCGKCEQHCPQHLEIRKELEKARKVLETPVYKFVRKAVKWLRLYH